jgi:hypothetical protein
MLDGRIVFDSADETAVSPGGKDHRS